MSRSFLLLWSIALLAPSWSSGADTSSATATASPTASHQRPILKTLSEAESLLYPTLGISITAPATTQLLGAHETQEAVNYVFPWLRTPLGNIDLAFAPATLTSHQGTLEEMFAKEQQHLHEHGTMLLPVGKTESKTLASIPMICQQYEGKRHFQLVRYYFVAPDGRLAFFHLYSARDMNALEHFLAEKLTKLETQPQKP